VRGHELLAHEARGELERELDLDARGQAGELVALAAPVLLGLGLDPVLAVDADLETLDAVVEEAKSLPLKGKCCRRRNPAR
jgi:hypothetical protein